MKIVICGSMNFAKEMLDLKQKLEQNGNIVVVPKNTEKHASSSVRVENKQAKIEQDLIRMHFNEIKESDAILLVNKDKNNIKNYIGGNGLIEMAFAHVLNKRIFLLNPIPKINYSDEIEAMKPMIINNNLERIK